MTHLDAVLNLSMREINVFMTAADEGSFTKAGEKLFMTQPMVSKCIAAMENYLGMMLFLRKHHGISLTPAGQVLYQSWKTLIQGMELTVANASSTQRSATQHMIINDYSTTVKKEYLWPMVKLFKDKYPDVEVLLETVFPGQGFERLKNNNCDVIFAPYCEAPMFEQRGAEWKHVLKCPQNVWINESNPLYCRETLEVANLWDETFIIVSPLVLSFYEKQVFDLCRFAGFEPKKIVRVADTSAATLKLKLGKGVVIRDRVFDSVEMTGIKTFELPGTCGGTIMAWSNDNSNLSLKRFVELYN